MIKTDILIQEITDVLLKYQQEAKEKNINGNENWTRDIKRYLGELGEKYDYKICASGFAGWFEPEWLFDLVWYSETQDGKNMLADVILAVESEWALNKGCIKYDFEKLLATNAKLKLMICQSKDLKHDELVEYFKQAIAAYRSGSSSDSFLIALLSYETEEFCFYSFKREQI